MNTGEIAPQTPATTAPSNNVLSIDAITSGYGDLKILRDVSINARTSRVTVVLGRNGAGKTTLLSTVAGLLKPSAGSIRLAGKDITKLSAPARTRQGISLVQENKRIFKRRTIEQNLRIGGYTLPRKLVAERVETAYSRFPILGQKRRLAAGGLSGGQQQMLAISQALMINPTLLMLDEPSAGLAPIITEELFDAIRQLKKEGMSILLVEQLVDLALSVADDVIIIEHGRVVSTTSASQTNRELVRRTYLG